MQAIVDEKAWNHFIEWPHKPSDQFETGWEAGITKISQTNEILKLANGDLYYGQINDVTKIPDGFGVLASKKGKSIH